MCLSNKHQASGGIGASHAPPSKTSDDPPLCPCEGCHPRCGVDCVSATRRVSSVRNGDSVTTQEIVQILPDAIKIHVHVSPGLKGLSKRMKHTYNFDSKPEVE
ncbi:hypothetical protein VFPPC_15635 [Pochonia chlamydosporia 170]|uniref:Uncharacterized protein n=1 Tax=Pochonia chlamydosporia 170 TaxID=1380566 RepID=A0A179FZ93_METCM|nr:hypothetical protein VFPPC_15635 [Pochonia chlamydosporia 170]OAQ70964.1 hypothetical protein VFPPC_15635 [Pochonia chlamydosporia 170]